MSNLEMDDKITWNLVFESSKHRHWIFRFLHPKFQHVYAMKQTRGGQFWLIVNPAASHLHIDMQPVSIYPTVRDFAGETATIVTTSATVDHFLTNKPLCFITCTEIVKALLGIRDRLCFTPYQLYRKLKEQKNEQRNQTRRERSQTC